MQVFSLLPILASLLAASGVSASAIGSAAGALTSCASETVVSEGYIGKDKNVKVTYSHCDAAPIVNTEGNVVSLDKRQSSNESFVNVCGAPCNTDCFSPAGGGPNQDDCTVIADALLYDNESLGQSFDATAAGTATDKVTMQYGSCLTYFLNQDANSTLEYCRDDWSTLVNWLASDCNAANGAHGGLCVAADGTWYVQVQNPSD